MVLPEGAFEAKSTRKVARMQRITPTVITVSVVICAHDSRENYLERVFEALCAQTLTQDRWELLLVDNASKQPLSERWDIGWHYSARHIREDELGLAPARLRGIAEAKGELLVFVDDDNVLTTNYLAEAVRIAHDWPRLGVWGGRIIPEFEIDPPNDLQKYLSHLTIVEITEPRWTNLPNCYEAFPRGAGMCLRREVGLAYSRFYRASEIQITDRRGTDLISGGDAEMCDVACNLGFGMGLLPDLELTHLIPKERLTAEYLIRLAEGIQVSGHLANYKSYGIIPNSPYSVIELLRFMKHVTVDRGIDRRMFIARCRSMRRARSILREVSSKPNRASQCQARKAKSDDT